MSVGEALLKVWDRLLRSRYAQTWQEACEERLKQELLEDAGPFHEEFPLLCADEWEVCSGMTNFGVGDLVFTDGHGGYAVVEVKWIVSGGKSRRNYKRRKVREQAHRYACAWARRFPDACRVVGYTFTDEWGLRVELPDACLLS